ncbi:MAG: DUF3795 domain-containing protein [Candidatus Bathyarchaeota archaeon]|nr:MAG: DUF3795 domain-containing protein [Candidatus Bathyarchaeota archaeon]
MKLIKERISLEGSGLADLVGYCGLYCNACGIRQGKIRDAVENLRNTIASYGFDKIMPELSQWEPSLKHYSQFEKVMDGLVKLFGDCPSCLQGGGDPNCQVRACAKQNNYRTCTECGEADSCEKITPYRKYYEDAAKALKQGDIREFAEEMQRKVDKGYSTP